MPKAAQYLKYANDCMDLAEKMQGPSKRKMEEIARAWLEAAREALGKQGEPIADDATTTKPN